MDARMTALVAAAKAHARGHYDEGGWLDDDQHEVWDAAVEAAERWEREGECPVCGERDCEEHAETRLDHGGVR